MKKAEYYITDGNNFVKQSINGQFSKVGNIAVADVWDKAQVAKAILDNSVPRAWRTTFYIAITYRMLPLCLMNTQMYSN